MTALLPRLAVFVFAASLAAGLTVAALTPRTEDRPSYADRFWRAFFRCLALLAFWSAAWLVLAALV